MTSDSLQKIYEEHHRSRNRGGFSVFEDERGHIFSENIGKGKTVLDIGCRDGTLTRHFSDGNTVLGVDIDERLLKETSGALGIETKRLDLNDEWKDLAGMRFDVIVAGEVMEHLYYPERIAERARTLLNEGGVFIGSVPNAFSLKNRIRLLFAKKKNTPLADPTHINHFSERELKNTLQHFFPAVTIVGLGRYKTLARLFPGLFAFDLIFIAHV